MGFRHEYPLGGAKVNGVESSKDHLLFRPYNFCFSQRRNDWFRRTFCVERTNPHKLHRREFSYLPLFRYLIKAEEPSIVPFPAPFTEFNVSLIWVRKSSTRSQPSKAGLPSMRSDEMSIKNPWCVARYTPEGSGSRVKSDARQSAEFRGLARMRRTSPMERPKPSGAFWSLAPSQG